MSVITIFSTKLTRNCSVEYHPVVIIFIGIGYYLLKVIPKKLQSSQCVFALPHCHYQCCISIL